MSKIIKLLESDLVKIVKQVLSEKIINEETYVVRPGDSLSKIAKRFGVSVKDIANQNNISDINKIRVGATLKINAGGQSTQTGNTQSTQTSNTQSTQANNAQSSETNDGKNYIKSFSFDSLWNNFPKDSSARDIYPVIFPKEYEKDPGTFGNACATRLSLTLNNLGLKPPRDWQTQQDFTWDGVTYKKGSHVVAAALRTPGYLKSLLGTPTFEGENTIENVKKHIYGKKAIFVLTKVPTFQTAKGHVDVVDYTKKSPVCASKLNESSCYFGEGGNLYVWAFPPTTKQTTTSTTPTPSGGNITTRQDIDWRRGTSNVQVNRQ